MICEECGKRENSASEIDGCSCPCVNCKSPMWAHADCYTKNNGGDCPDTWPPTLAAMRLISNVQNTIAADITNHIARDDDATRPVCGARVSYDQGSSPSQFANCGRCVAIVERKIGRKLTDEERRGR